MTKNDAIEFLRQHQPMPPTDALHQEEVDRYEEIRRFFLKDPDPICIPLFLNSFGEGDCYGVYQLVEDILRIFSQQDLIPHLVKSLRSEHRSVRYWSAQIAAVFPSIELIESLSALLEEEDYGIKYSSITALEQIDDPKVNHILKKTMEHETDKEILELIKEVLSERG